MTLFLALSQLTSFFFAIILVIKSSDVLRNAYQIASHSLCPLVPFLHTADYCKLLWKAL